MTALYDAGDVGCKDDDLEAAQADYAQHAAQLLRAGHRVIGLGGGHEIAWASYQGIAAAFSSDRKLERLGVEHVAEYSPCFDAPDARTARTAARLVYELAAISR